MVITIILTTLVILLATLFYVRRKWSYGIFKRLGIPGPTPNIFLGNLIQTEPQGVGKSLFDWYKKYGKTFGYFEGPVPILATADIEIIKAVYIKNFSNFHFRKYFPMAAHGDHEDAHMFLMGGDRWKRVRSIVSPTFSSSKMKQMAPIINDAVDVLLEVIENKVSQNKPFDIATLFKGLTLDVIGSCAFGLDIDAQRNKNEPFRVECERVFATISQANLLVLTALVFPELNELVFKSRIPLTACGLWSDPWLWLTEKAAEIIDLRKKHQFSRIDFIQLMLNAHAQLPSSVNDLTMSEVQQTSTDHVTQTAKSFKSQKKSLTEKEIMSNSVLFIIAGFETTSTALAYASYQLALNPDVQDKLIEEINHNIPHEGQIEMSEFNQLTYLDMVTNEVLRLHPIAPSVIARRCENDVTINGVFIPRNLNVTANVYALHYDAEYWGPYDPYEFHPERFAAEWHDQRDPLAFMPFGAGPRNCVGMRFALLEMKLTLVKLLKRFKLVKCSDTEIPLQTQERGTIVPKNGIVLKVERRQ